MTPQASRRAFLRRAMLRPGRRCAIVDAALCAGVEGDCRACLPRCPVPGALVWTGGRPLAVPALCDGCGECVLACAAVSIPAAIQVRSLPWT